MNMDIFKLKKPVPFIPKPEPKEIPVREELVQDPKTAPNVRMVKLDTPLLVPNYNTLYDTFRAKQIYGWSNDAYATGSFTATNGTEVNSAVTLANDPQWKLDQWPGGTLLYLMIRSFSIATTSTAFATSGALRITFTDIAGNVVPLAMLRTFNTGEDTVNLYPHVIIPSPLTNPGERRIGILNTLLNTGASDGDYTWQLGFSAMYLLPAMKGYSVDRLTREERDI